jgi:hemerythrin-like domain-containing protein
VQVEGRSHIRNLQQALESCRAGNRSAAADFRAHALQYRDFLRQHIQKEDNVLFRIASERLSEDQLIALEKDFERLENEKIGPGKHEELHRMLDDFEKKYGGGGANR